VKVAEKVGDILKKRFKIAQATIANTRKGKGRPLVKRGFANFPID
jgi:hypothetical protein